MSDCYTFFFPLQVPPTLRKQKDEGKKVFSSMTFFFKSGNNKAPIKVLHMINVTEVLCNSFIL